MIGRETILPSITEAREIREKYEMVRVLLFQSRDEESIARDEVVADICFTSLLMAHKSEGVAAGTVMFVGGRIRPNEDVKGAALRRCVEKTHLRPTRQSIEDLPTEQRHVFSYPARGGLVEHHNHYLAGCLLPEPMDQPYALDAEGDRIDSFVRINLSDFDSLLKKGSVGRSLDIVDSLRPTKEPDSVQEKIKREMLFSFRVVEAKKKMDVLHKLYFCKIQPSIKETLRLSDDAYRDRIQTIATINSAIVTFDNKFSTEKAKALDNVDKTWKIYTNKLSTHQIKQALRYSNYEAVIDNITETYIAPSGEKVSTFNPETGEGIPSINLVLPLLVKDELNYSELRVLARNRQALKILRIVQLLKNKQQATRGAPLDFEKIAEELRRSELVNLKSSFLRLSEGVDDFFAEMYNLKDVEIIDQFNELKTYKEGDISRLRPQLTLDLLWKYATGRVIPARIQAAPNELEKAKRVKTFRFEAQRKFMLMLLLNDAMQIYNLVEKRGIEYTYPHCLDHYVDN